MQLTAKGRYAVTALADLAGRGGAPASLAEIAEAQGLSRAFLEQLFGKLRKAGIVESVRGPGGGYRIAQAASDVSISAILEAVGETVRSTGCKKASSEACTGVTGRCLSHPLWSALDSHIDAFLGSITLEQVAAQQIPQSTAEARP